MHLLISFIQCAKHMTPQLTYQHRQSGDPTQNRAGPLSQPRVVRRGVSTSGRMICRYVRGHINIHFWYSRRVVILRYFIRTYNNVRVRTCCVYKCTYYYCIIGLINEVLCNCINHMYLLQAESKQVYNVHLHVLY